MSIYKQALRNHIRFEFKGLRSTEELWELKLEELDGLFQQLNVQRKSRSEESLLSDKSTEVTELDLKIEIIKDIVETLLKEKADRQEAAAKAAQKKKILEAIARKNDSALETMTVEELEQMASSL
jgi:signal recognition particle GTPase